MVQEGFDTADLQAARTLLDDLEPPPRTRARLTAGAEGPAKHWGGWAVVLLRVGLSRETGQGRAKGEIMISFGCERRPNLCRKSNRRA
jgi:hypothetical protein